MCTAQSVQPGRRRPKEVLDDTDRKPTRQCVADQVDIPQKVINPYRHTKCSGNVGPVEVEADTANDHGLVAEPRKVVEYAGCWEGSVGMGQPTQSTPKETDCVGQDDLTDPLSFLSTSVVVAVRLFPTDRPVGRDEVVMRDKRDYSHNGVGQHEHYGRVGPLT